MLGFTARAELPAMFCIWPPACALPWSQTEKLYPAAPHEDAGLPLTCPPRLCASSGTRGSLLDQAAAAVPNRHTQCIFII